MPVPESTEVSWTRWAATLVVAPVVIGPLVFLASGLMAGMGPGEVLEAFAEQASGRRMNPVLGSVLGVVPAALLALVLWIGAKRGADPGRLRTMGWCGLATLLLMLVWAHASVWGPFLPDRQPLGFPHGLELVIVPLFFAPPAVLVAALVGWLVSGRTG